MRALLDCTFARWRPEIGDPTAMGWVTVAVYALAALVAALVAASASFPRHRGRRERMFWIGLALALAFLAVNKQLDLQSFLTAVGRCISQMQGWYEERRAVQRDFILALIAASAVAGLGLLWLLRGTLGRTWLALLGFVFLIGFVLVRAVGFHHMDALINARILDVRMNWGLELAGLALILAGGALRLAGLGARA